MLTRARKRQQLNLAAAGLKPETLIESLGPRVAGARFDPEHHGSSPPNAAVATCDQPDQLGAKAAAPKFRLDEQFVDHANFTAELI
jgi:hypothetical protein